MVWDRCTWVTDVVSKCKLETNHHLCFTGLLRSGELGGDHGMLAQERGGVCVKK